MAPTKTTALVIGDVMLDRRIEGPLTRFSPEAPAPVMAVESVTDVPGGAANVAMNIASLGREVQLLGIIGDDTAGRRLYELLDAAEGVWPRLLLLRDKTTCKTRLTVDGRQVFRLDDDGEPVRGNPWLLQAIAEAMASAPVGVVVVSDYAKGALTAEDVAAIKELCRTHGIPMFVDTKPSHMDWYAGVALLKPNLAEAMEAADACVHPGLWVGNGASCAAIAGRWLRQKLGFQSVVVTMGVDGAYIVADPQEYHIPAVAHRVYDVTGAGDTFMAALAVGYLNANSLLLATTNAIIAAGLAVQEYGTVAVSRGAWREAQQQRPGVLGKVMDLDTAAELADWSRNGGKRVAFVNGCFDLLHAGHVHLLQTAYDHAEVVIVGLNTDASVRRLKGPTRPVLSDAQRARHLAALSHVAAIVPFEEDTPELLIRAIRPDVLVKGAEYMGQVVPGADHVASYGGDVVFVPMLPISTTGLIGGS